MVIDLAPRRGASGAISLAKISRAVLRRMKRYPKPDHRMAGVPDDLDQSHRGFAAEARALGAQLVHQLFKKRNAGCHLFQDDDSLGLCVSVMGPGSQMTEGTPALWNNPDSAAVAGRPPSMTPTDIVV